MAHEVKLSAVLVQGYYEVRASYCYDGYQQQSLLGSVVHDGEFWRVDVAHCGDVITGSDRDLHACLQGIRGGIESVDAAFAREEDDWFDVDAQVERAIENANHAYAEGQTALDAMHGM